MFRKCLTINAGPLPVRPVDFREIDLDRGGGGNGEESEPSHHVGRESDRLHEQVVEPVAVLLPVDGAQIGPGHLIQRQQAECERTGAVVVPAVPFIIAATPAPHAQILEVVKEILAAKDITLKIEVFTGYTEENPAVDAGDAYANYFQHQPYLDDYVAETGGNVVSVAIIHTEPMGLYGGRQADLAALGK